MTTLTPEQQAEERAERMQVANTIRGQISVGVFMSLGASDLQALGLGYDHPGLAFKARIIPTGQSKARVMDVHVTLSPADLYDIKVTYQAKGKRFDPPVVHFEAEGVFAEDLSRVLLGLDKEG